jgi:hypothetical protein
MSTAPRSVVLGILATQGLDVLMAFHLVNVRSPTQTGTLRLVAEHEGRRGGGVEIFIVPFDVGFLILSFVVTSITERTEPMT